MDNYSPLDITVISATGLKNIFLFFRMKVYVVVSLINGNTIIEKKTHSSRGRNPKWDHRVKFPVEESAIPTTTLLFVLRQRRIWGDKDIGEVSIPVEELLETNSGSSEHVVDYQVRSVRGKSVGTFTFSHRFREKISPAQDATGRTSSSHPPVTTHMSNQQGVPTYHQTPGYGNYPGGAQYGTGAAWYPPTTQPGGYPYPPQDMGYNQQMQQRH
ncbi:hypothetical protein L1987_07936 [Smallanthus sonchifolius]|uniref:Uncharacterized protein n=1 Tax=Smallanthus sonchifolius TaxID=185202 RepID=A0ACB9JKW0_9ASTR|nr:hypothetical protein L1987_07936 [Smallanthus sonchifolius]